MRREEMSTGVLTASGLRPRAYNEMGIEEPTAIEGALRTILSPSNPKSLK